MFQTKSSSKPTVLIVAGSLFAQFKPSRFTQHLDTTVKSVVTADEATKTINNLTQIYDAIVLQLVTDDVKHFDVKVCYISKTMVVTQKFYIYWSNDFRLFFYLSQYTMVLQIVRLWCEGMLWRVSYDDSVGVALPSFLYQISPSIHLSTIKCKIPLKWLLFRGHLSLVICLGPKSHQIK